MRRTTSRRHPSIAPVLVVLAGVAACAGRGATVESEAPLAAIPTEADFYGTYDIHFAGAPGQGAEAAHAAPLAATWSATDFVVRQDGDAVIRTDISIDPTTSESGEIRIWDDRSTDPLCSAEGIYDYTDDGRAITLELRSDPCPNRRSQADGARLVRRG